MNFMRLYLKQKKTGMLLFGLCIVSCISVFALYHLPFEAMVYPLGLCLLFGMVYLLQDIKKVWKQHEKRMKIQEFSDLDLGLFPVEGTIEDLDYQRMIAILQKENRELESKMNRRYFEMMEYYTVWVHQIKTPIASIRLHLQNEDSPLSRQISEDLFRIEQYVEMALCYLRLDSDSTDYVFREYDLDAIVKPVVRKFAGQFIRRKLRLHYEPLGESVITDEKWLAFVLEQVLSNALKYTQEGSVTIEMENSKTLCIRDTGIGIASEDLPRIFERGYTGCNGRRDKKASGLGLYLCKRICSNLGHGITAESSPEKGTVIRLDLRQVKLERE